MNRSFLRGILLSVFVSASTALAGEPLQKVNTAAADSKFPPTYANRTFKEWQRTLNDLDYNTRYPAYPAMVAFARNGYEKEALAAVEIALAKEEHRSGFGKGYAALRGIGKTGDSLLLRDLKKSSGERLSTILTVLEAQYRRPPGNELIAAILEKVNSKEEEWWIRRDACVAVANQVLEHPRPPLVRNAIPQPDVAIEPHLKLVLPALERLLTDEDVRLSHAAANALLKISVRRPRLVATVLDYLDSELSNPRATPVGSMSSQNYGHLLLNELSQFVTQPGAREALLPAMSHLKTLRDKHQSANGTISSIMMQLDPTQGRQGRIVARGRPVQVRQGVEDDF